VRRGEERGRRDGNIIISTLHLEAVLHPPSRPFNSRIEPAHSHHRPHPLPQYHDPHRTALFCPDPLSIDSNSHVRVIILLLSCCHVTLFYFISHLISSYSDLSRHNTQHLHCHSFVNQKGRRNITIHIHS
jgi:hypothetical protein